MKIQLDIGEAVYLKTTAKQFGVSNEALTEMYVAIMNRNFQQDVWDIANENLEELKGEE